MYKKIIISLDGFDSYSEDFRRYTQKLPKDSQEYKDREEYELYFFRELISVVTAFKSGVFKDPVLSTFQEYLDFCIVLPKDRYDQIISADRDSAKKKFGSLIWDAYDLLDLIVRRLEYLISKFDHNIKFDATKDLFDRFQDVINFFPGIPRTITINIDGHNMQMELFNYLLRFSFWRPRDIISNFSSILAYVISSEGSSLFINKSAELLDNEMIKLTIKCNSRKIIQQELIDEYRNVFRNLEDVLNNFIDSDLIINVEDFVEKLSKIHFDASYAYNLDKVSEKINVLYQLGLIGLYFDKSVAKSLGYLHHMCFVFNAGLEPIQNFYKYENYKNVQAKIIFNPILSERLSLKIDTKELIGNWDKDYIKTLHKMKPIIHTI